MVGTNAPGGNTLAQEAAAQIQLGLFGTVGKLAGQLRHVDRLAPVLHEGGIVRRLDVQRDIRRRSVGVAAAGRKIGAFGGLLYAVAALEQKVVTEGTTVVKISKDSRLDVGDMTYLEADRRLDWKTYGLVYDLLDELFSTDQDLPEIVILDVPLVMGRAVYAQSLDEAETDRQLKDEIGGLRDRVESFWKVHRDSCFPFHPDGPRVVSLGRRRFGSLLRLVEETGGRVSPDTITAGVQELLRSRWAEVLSIGLDRLLAGILTGGHRTAAFDYNLGGLDKTAFPRSLIDGGMLGFHYVAGLRGRPVQVETVGAADLWHARGASAVLDDLTAALIGLTYFDHPTAVPLPLWYAREGVKVVKERGLLEFYKRETLRAMREQTVEQTWLASWEVDDQQV